MDWLTILVRCGCSTMVAQNWAPIFAAEAAPEKFSLGRREMPQFLANVLHESAYLTRLEENLNYSAERLVRVWPSRFPTIASAQPFARNPQALANRVYGGRMGNIGPDDGWRYRGRGLIQVTGRDNYARLGPVMKEDLLLMPDLLLSPRLALRSAVAWWEGNVPDGVMADSARVRRAVNGGTIGLDDVQRLAQLASWAIGRA